MRKIFENIWIIVGALIMLVLSIFFYVKTKDWKMFFYIIPAISTLITTIFIKTWKKEEVKPTSEIHIEKSKNVNTGNVNTGGGNFRLGDN